MHTAGDPPLDRPEAPVTASGVAGAATGDAGAAPPRMRSVRHGAMWTLIGFGAAQVIRFASNLVLTRLLVKQDFGTASLAFSFLTGISMVGDLGIWAAVIQNPSGQQRQFRDTAWTLQWIRSLVLTAVAFAAAPYVADYYATPELAAMIRWAAVSTWIGNLIPTSFYVAGRNMDLARTAAIDLTSQVLGTSVTIGLACWRPGPAVMVYGALAGVCVRYAMIRAIFGGGDRLAWDRPALHAILKFGTWTALSSMVTFAVGQADRLVFGSFVSRELLGVYSISATLAGVPGDILGRLVLGVLFPVLARAVHGNAIDPAVFRRYRMPLFGVGGFAVACLCGGASAVVGFLYPHDYTEAVWMVQILGVSVWINSVLESPRTTALLALGHSRWSFLTGLAKLVAMPVLIPLGYWWLGFPGAMLGYAGADLCRLVVSVLGCRRHGLRDLGTDLGMTAWVGLTALLGNLVCSLTAHRLDDVLHPRLAHALAGCAVALVVGLAWLPLLLQFLRTRKLLRQGRL